MDSKIYDRLDKIYEELKTQSNTLTRHSVLHEKNTEDLSEHIKRTNALETRMEQHARDHDNKLEQALLPIKVAKGIVYLATVSATLIGLYKLL